MESIHKTTDFQAVFSNFGRAISRGEPAQKILGGLWSEVFGGQPVQVPKPTSAPFPGVKTGMTRLSEPITVSSVLAQLPRAKTPTLAPAIKEDKHPPAPAQAPEPTSHPYNGPTPPEHASMAYESLNLPQTVTPVMGVISSGYGYREHPVDDEYKFHYGTDIGAELGTAVGAFAEGVVDFIGESPAYGLYIQVRHSGDITTFYAHCSKLCVGQGTKVSMGEKIAEVGDTGNATGPHLHLELKRNGVFLDPSYYVETQ